MKKKVLAAVILLAAAAAVLCLVLLRPGSAPAGVKILVDGEELTGAATPEIRDDLQVILTLDGEEIARFPFGEAHTIRILQDNGYENNLVLTGESVYMESANCEGQDCVHMEPVTRDNLETRVMSGMIICLPHRLSIEVR